MNDTLLQISVDFLLIFRVLLAFLWGVGWAVFIQFNRYGKFLAKERTWITVVVGVGVDLLISYPFLGSYSDWYTTALVISFSSIGIIVRSLHNEQEQDRVNFRSYKLIWGLEDAIALSGKINESLMSLLTVNGSTPDHTRAINQIMATTHKLANTLRAARRGDYSQKNSK